MSYLNFYFLLDFLPVRHYLSITLFPLFISAMLIIEKRKTKSPTSWKLFFIQLLLTKFIAGLLFIVIGCEFGLNAQSANHFTGSVLFVLTDKDVRL